MKQLLFCLFVILSLVVKAQVNIHNLSLTDSIQNILYIGVENKISITGKGYNEVKQAVRISGGRASITKIALNDYIVRAAAITDSCKISVEGKNGKTTAEKTFKVKVIPDMKVKLGKYVSTD